jgi:hypothetical protein
MIVIFWRSKHMRILVDHSDYIAERINMMQFAGGIVSGPTVFKEYQEQRLWIDCDPSDGSRNCSRKTHYPLFNRHYSLR